MSLTNLNLNINTENESIPWIEKFRPSEFEDIVLDPLNKEILQNIIKTSYFPNLLLYGPPGTGKTTTIINLINKYQDINNEKNRGLVIHLNASDERGIDIIRNQINQFVNSKTLFTKGMKFVILDEVDYMTKNAQQALKYLLQNYSNNVRFCLICNYISRIDEGLQNEFLRLRFNQLPQEKIIEFLKNITKKELININDTCLKKIQEIFKSDIRSMINYLQSNQDMICENFHIIDNIVWEGLYQKCINNNKTNKVDEILDYIKETRIKYNINKKNIIKDFLNYIIRYKQNVVTSDFLIFIENAMHFPDCEQKYYINYIIYKLLDYLPKAEQSNVIL
uniref:AAA+ ATPase domain-containing protein n=1 Tax=viral metagenome TaxID=1070528 RepID=A0A6C0DIJ8_9ZZZZ